MLNRGERANAVWANLSLRVKGWIVIAIPLIALLVSALSIGVLQQQDRSASSWVSHTYQVRSEIRQTLTMLVDAQTATRGYALTAEGSFLDPFRQAQQELPQHLSHLQSLIQDNPAQVTRMNRIVPMAAQEIGELASLQQLSQSPAGPQSPEAQQQRQASEETMTSLRQDLGAMDNDEARLLSQRTARVSRLVD